MGKFIDLTGQTFNDLTVLYKAESQKGRVFWHCKCSCGNEKDIRADGLKAGKIKTCGECKNIRHLIDLTGQTFGQLTVLEKDNEKIGNKTYWICQCSCGNKKSIRGDQLKSGEIKTCGCGKINNLIGKVFGKLTVLEQTDKRINRNIVWKCQCECGNIYYATTHNLVNGHICSCGCLSSSIGELTIKKLLENNNILFKQQMTFENCKNKHLLPFDFYVNNKYLIEFDGIQHFQPIEYFGGITEFKERKQNDEIKNNYCKINNIPLIRIPYTALKTLQLEDLLLETTQYLIN